MTEMIYGWMKNLACFFIFMTAVLNCLPESKYRKYVRFFLGMLVIIVLGGPLTELLHLDQALADAVSRGLLEGDAEGLEDRMELGGFQEDVQEEYLLRGYEAEIESQIEAYLRERGVVPEQTEVRLDGTDMTVEEIRLSVSADTEGLLYQSEADERKRALKEEAEAVKKELSEVYQVDAEHIDVTIQG